MILSATVHVKCDLCGNEAHIETKVGNIQTNYLLFLGVAIHDAPNKDGWFSFISGDDIGHWCPTCAAEWLNKARA